MTWVISEIRGSPPVNEVTPLSPKDTTGLPVCASSENSRWRLFRNMRSLPPSRQKAVPRSFHPLLDNTCPSLYPSPSNRHSSLPVSASTAAMLLYGVVTYSTPSIIRGVFSKKPGAVPYSGSGASQCFHCHAICSRWIFPLLTSVSGEYLLLPGSPP